MSGQKPLSAVTTILVDGVPYQVGYDRADGPSRTVASALRWENHVAHCVATVDGVRAIEVVEAIDRGDEATVVRLLGLKALP